MITETCITFSRDSVIDRFAASLSVHLGSTATEIAADVRGMVAESGMAIFNGFDAEIAANVARETDGAAVVC